MADKVDIRGENMHNGSGINPSYMLRTISHNVVPSQSKADVRTNMNIFAKSCHESSVGHLTSSYEARLKLIKNIVERNSLSVFITISLKPLERILYNGKPV